jgi:hypothetical protein
MIENDDDDSGLLCDKKKVEDVDVLNFKSHFWIVLPIFQLVRFEVGT